MTARATLATEYVVGRGASRVQRLRSKTPLVLRPAHPKGPEPLVHRAGDIARVALASGAAGPLGGDELELDIRVGARSTLVLSEISATLLLPGARGVRSRMHINIVVDDGGTLVWLPEPVIAADGCDHSHDIDIKLAPNARLYMHDQLLLGRHREPPGDLTQNLRIERDGHPLLHQQLRFGPSARGSTSPAVLGANQCVGTAVAVEPAWDETMPAAYAFADNAALLPLPGPAMMINALAPETLSVRRLINQGLSALGPPWVAEKATSSQLAENEAPESARGRERRLAAN